MSARPSCFISYSWDSARHQRWVARLAAALASNGVETHLDLWEAHYGADLTKFMERSIRDSRFVLLICTPRYAERADDRRGGVGYETGVVTGELFERASDQGRFVPLLRGPDPAKALPTYLKGRKYLDARSKRRFETYLRELLHHLWEQPLHAAPPLGPPPPFVRPVVPPPPDPAAAKGVAAGTESGKELDRAIADRESELAALQRQVARVHPAATTGADPRTEAISRLSYELAELRRRKEGSSAAD